MKKYVLWTLLGGFALLPAQKYDLKRVKTFTLDSLGACQGVLVRDNSVFLYGDREVGVLREYAFKNDSLILKHPEIRLEKNAKDLINHPTGIAPNPSGKLAFIGNSSRMNDAGTLWKANIFMVKWKELLKNRILQNSYIKEIEDDAAVQGTRPEFIRFKGKDYVATADYGPKNNEVRFYNFKKLQKADKTSEKGVLAFRFKCSPWVQNLHWIADKGILVLVQNQIEGRYWRLTFLDLEKSLQQGKEAIIQTFDFDDASELEGFAFVNNDTGIAVTSSRKNNVSILKLTSR